MKSEAGEDSEEGEHSEGNDSWAGDLYKVKASGKNCEERIMNVKNIDDESCEDAG